MREEDEDYEQVTVAVPLVCIPSLCCRPASRTDRLYRFPGESYGGSCTCRFSGCFVCHGSYPVESSPQFLPAIIQAATRFPSGARQFLTNRIGRKKQARCRDERACPWGKSRGGLNY